jgi:hypothetical protein
MSAVFGRLEHAVNQAAGSKSHPAVKAIKRAVDEAIAACLPPEWHAHSQLGGGRAKGDATEGGDVDLYVRTASHEVTKRQRTGCGRYLHQLLAAGLPGSDYRLEYGRKATKLRSPSRTHPDVDVVFELFNAHAKPPPAACQLSHAQKLAVRYLKGMQEAAPVPRVPGYELEAFVQRASSGRADFGGVLRGCLSALGQGRQVTKGSALGCDAWVGQAQLRLRELQ